MRPVPILMYHAVSRFPSAAASRLSVSPDAFAGQMALLAEAGRTPLTTAELARLWRTGRALPRRPVLITFDDGYEGVHRYALPVLARHGFTATVFASTGWLRGPHTAGTAPDVMLDWSQLRELAAAGVEIGGHSHRHRQLDQLDDRALRHEVVHCRELLSQELGDPPRSFAYPFGYSTRRVREAVRSAGFVQSVAVGNTLADPRRQNPYALARLTVRRSTTPAEFTRLLGEDTAARTLVADRALSKGYAVLRGARRALRKAHLVRV
ncbi:polysaccharide deacetylase family protein [Streptomyces sp. 549]|uniref:polysaccharide deacetylase family protein n=1 Tax=Streptomyces sp. 549 TaxID=3049076 RepID=UPI0024C39063|nr:polysaccharide deacetylase family protein [Streptomyces sp. 549]MDK1475688.1 polysaccharide deacetylase family protein [Streptomyces sp. 549]